MAPKKKDEVGPFCPRDRGWGPVLICPLTSYAKNQSPARLFPIDVKFMVHLPKHAHVLTQGPKERPLLGRFRTNLKVGGWLERSS
jgi:hypothetical protein